MRCIIVRRQRPDFGRMLVSIFAACVLAYGVTSAQAQAPAPSGPTSSPAAQIITPPTTDPSLAASSRAEPVPAPSTAAAANPAAPSENGKAATQASEASRTPAKDVPGTGSALIPHDLSPWGMFLAADIIVKAVMVGLSFASLVTWTVFFAKWIELAGARRRASRGLAHLARASTLRAAAASLHNPKATVTRFVAAALAETEQSSGLSNEGTKDRASALLSRIESRAGRAMARGTGLLATIGSTAPFVGLFGTVWGIMNAFIGISKTNTTNLAVVAPGIAEALLATAFGLVAAIPAVIIYNMFARSITGYRSLLGDASTEVMRLLSRDLDRMDSSGQRSPMGRAAE